MFEDNQPYFGRTKFLILILCVLYVSHWPSFRFLSRKKTASTWTIAKKTLHPSFSLFLWLSESDCLLRILKRVSAYVPVKINNGLCL